MRRFLVVTNQTLGSVELVGEMHRRAVEEPTEFHFLVPATLAVSHDRGAPLPPPADEDVEELVQRRLDNELVTLRRDGLQVKGLIAGPDPVRAVRGVLERRVFDEIIVSTLPRGASRWLRLDLVTQVRRRASVPVTHVECSRSGHS